MEQPVILKFQAKKDGSVDQAFSGTQKGAESLQTQFSKIASESEGLYQALLKLRQEAEKSGRGFAKGGKESQQALSETAQAAKQAADSVRKAEEEKAAARAKARKDLEFALREEEKYRQAVVDGSRQAAQAAKQAADEQAAALRQTREEMEKNRQLAAELGPALAIGLTAAGAALGGLAAYAVQTANSFEQMEAQLVTAMGSASAAAKAMADAQSFAARSPFDVEGVVKATVQLEVYGQRSQTVLPRVAALAAGMGKRIEDTSLVVGKALSGSLEGFESLRNEYGITTRELVRFGAEQNKAGGIMVQTAAQAEQARKALLSIIDLRYGDAVERQAATLSGQIEKVKDEMTGFAAEVGKGAAEVVKFGAAFVGGGFEMLRKLPAPIKEAAGALLTISTGLAAAGGAALTFGGGLVWLMPRIVAAQASFAAMGGMQGALFVMEQRFNAMGLTAIPRVGTALAALAGPTAVIGGIAAAWGAATAATNRYIDAQKQLQAEMAEQSRLFQQRIQENRDLAKALDNLAKADAQRKGEAPPEESVGFGFSPEELEKIAKILDNAAASDFFREMKAAGFTAEETNRALEQIGDQIKHNKEEVKRYQAELKRAEAYRDEPKRASIGMAAGGLRRPERSPEDVQNDLREAQKQGEAYEGLSQKLEDVRKKHEETTVTIDEMGKAAQRASDVLKYKDKLKDLKSMNEAYGILAQQIALSAAKLTELNEPTDRNSLLDRLQRGKYTGEENAEIREKVLAHLDLLDEQDKRQEELRKKGQEGDRAALQELKTTLSEARAAREVDSREALANLAEQYEIAKRLGKEGENELTRIRTEAAAERRRQEQEDLQARQTTAKAALEAAKALPVAARSSEKGTQAAVDAYDTAIRRVKAWAAANQDLISKFPELGRQGQAAIQALDLGRAQAEVQRLNKNFSDLQESIRDIERDAVSTADKLEAVARARNLVKEAQGAGQISDEQAAEINKDQGHKEKDLQRQDAQEQLAHRQKMLALAQQSAQQELAIQETLADGSLRSNDKLLVARERLHQLRIQQIRLEAEAAIQAGADEVRVAEETAEKIRQIERQKTADLHAELKKRYQSEKERLQGIIDENTDEAKPALDFGVDTTADDKRRARKAAEKELAALEQAERFRKANPEAVTRMAEEDRKRALTMADPTGILQRGQAMSSPKVETPGNVVNNVNNVVHVNVEGRKTRTVGSSEEAVREVRKAITTNQFYDPNAGV